MARAFWKGVISFGLVVIPVKMYVATEAHTLGLHVLHKKCLTRPKQVWFCEHDEQYLSVQETTRGYEYAKDRYLVLEESDFKKVPVKTTHTIEIQGFVESHEIDFIYYQSSHYLEPEELGVKPFALLKETLAKTDRVGIAKVTFQRREHLCALRPLDNLMALHTLYYQEEIIGPEDKPAGRVNLNPAELEMARSLVKAMETNFHPEKYRDEYREGLKQVIEAKMKGLEIKPPEEHPAEIPDLMAALKASVAAASQKKSPSESKKP